MNYLIRVFIRRRTRHIDQNIESLKASEKIILFPTRLLKLEEIEALFNYKLVF